MVNNVTLTGHLTATPELKTTQNGIAYCSFTVAVDKPYKKGEERKADFIPMTAWRTTAEFLCRNFVKGQLIAVEGSLRPYTFEKNGEKRYSMDVQAKELHFLGSKPSNNSQSDDAIPDDFVEHFMNSDDIPF